jgi:hypothetical protein
MAKTAKIWRFAVWSKKNFFIFLSEFEISGIYIGIRINIVIFSRYKAPACQHIEHSTGWPCNAKQ